MRHAFAWLAVLFILHASPSAGQSLESDAAPDGVEAPASEDGGAQPVVPGSSAPLDPAAIAATEGDKPFKRLVPNLFKDLRRYPSKSSALVLGLGAAFAGASYPIDRDVTEHASAGGTDQQFAVAGVIGGGYVQAGGAMAAYVVGRLAHAPKLTHTAADLIRAQAVNGVVTHALKISVRRPRPGGAPGHMPATYSFPSAHASATWATATVLWRHHGWRVGAPAAAIATYVSGARLQQGQHFLSDVIFGAALGVVAGRTVTFGHGDRSPVLALAPVPGGAGVTVTVPGR